MKRLGIHRTFVPDAVIGDSQSPTDEVRPIA